MSFKTQNLAEFLLKASKHKISKRYSNKNFRIGDYVYFVDISKQEIFGCHAWQTGSSNNFFPIGGGRESGEDSIESLIREIIEEIPYKLNIDSTKFIEIATFQVVRDYYREDEKKHYDGKEMHIYFYAIDKHNLQAFESKNYFGEIEEYDWLPLEEVINQTKFISGEYNFINFPIWQEFCRINNILGLEITKNTAIQYLAWDLERENINSYEDFGSISSLVFDNTNLDVIVNIKHKVKEKIHLLRNLYI